MPIKPKPFAYVCSACGWRKVIAPRSDALVAGEYFEYCPSCGKDSLTRENLSDPAGLALGVIRKFLKF